MKTRTNSVRAEINLARRKWVGIRTERMAELRKLVRRYHLSVFLGDVMYMEDRWYVTHAGLLRLAHRKHCSGIKTTLERRYSEPSASRWVFRAIVYNSCFSKGFVGYGDADPSNVSPLVRGAEMRVAETRAVNRALRKAYGIGLCSVEELGSFSAPTPPSHPKQAAPFAGNGNGSGHSQPRLRDQLCLLIRQFNLDPTLVKAYAADFCGTEALKEASRDLVESFIAHISKAANEDRNALICKLNSYAQSMEVKP
jgi:hypothetical protein